MRFSKQLCGFSALAIVLGTGCAGSPGVQTGGSNGATPSLGSATHSGSGWLSPDARSKELVYISSGSGNVVYIYPKEVAPGSNPAPTGEITDGIVFPSGSFVDRHGDLFVANNGNYTVTMYPRGSTTWTLRYTGFEYPNNVAVDAKGTVYIADFSGDKVVEFPKGKTRSKLTIQLGYPPHGVALDANDNLYVSYNTGAHGGGPGDVNEYSPGSANGANLELSIGWAGGDVIDGSGNILVADQLNAAVDIFSPGITLPKQKITQGLSDPVNLAFDKSFKHLYVEDDVVDGVLVYDYPSGTYVTTLNNGATGIDGIAVSPEGN
jgi:sugar lactone lactonase YvrE